MTSETQTKFRVRGFTPDDHIECRKLYHDGRIGGTAADNDSALDIDDIESAYMKSDGNHFWVATLPDGRIVGMIGVMKADGTGEIRRLRVCAEHRRRGIGSALLETALRFCQTANYLKVALDTFVEREAAVKLFQKFHFRHGRTRPYAGKELMDFYLDLYSPEDSSPAGA